MSQMEKLSIQLPADVKERLGTTATKANVSMNQVIIQAVCKHLGMAIPAQGTRRGKYATPAERYEAEKAVRQARSKLATKLLQEFRKAQQAQAVKALSESLKAKKA